jgi:hypothetical protein
MFNFGSSMADWHLLWQSVQHCRYILFTGNLGKTECVVSERGQQNNERSSRKSVLADGILGGSFWWKAGALAAVMALGAAVAMFLQPEPESAPIMPSSAQPPAQQHNTVASTAVDTAAAAVPSHQSAETNTEKNTEEKTMDAVAAIESEPTDADAAPNDAVKPSPAVIQAIREARKPVPGEGEVITNSDGSKKVNLGNRYMSAPVATIGKDGKVHVDYHGEKYAEDSAQSNPTTRK